MFFIKLLCLLAVMLGLQSIVFGQANGDYQSNGSGTWGTAGTWQVRSGGAWIAAAAAPTSANGNITIRNGHTVTVGANVTIDQLTIASGGTLLVTKSFTGVTLTIANGSGTDLTNNGTLTIGSSIISFGFLTNNGQIVNNATFTNGPSSSLSFFTNSAGATFTNSSTGTFTNNNSTTNNGTVSNSGTIQNNGLLGITNNLTITNNGTINNATSGTITNAAAGTITNTATITNSTTITNNGIISNSATGTITNTGTISNSLTYTNSGVTTNNATFTNNAAGTITNNLTFTNNSTLTNNGTVIIAAAGTLSNTGTVTNNLTITNNGILTNSAAGTITNAATRNITNNLTFTNSGTVTNNGIVTNAAAGTITNNLTFTNNSTLTNNGMVTIAAAGTLTNNLTFTNNLTVTNNGTITNAAAGTITNAVSQNITNNLICINNGTITNNGNILNSAIGTATNNNVITNNSLITNDGNFTNNSAGTLSVAASASVVNNRTFVNNGIITNAGTVTNNSTMQSNAGSTYNHNQNGGNVPTATWDASSNCVILGTTNTKPTNLTQTFGNFIWNCTTQSASHALGGFLNTVVGNFTVQHTNSQILQFANAAATLNVGGYLTISNGTVSLSAGTINSVYLNIGSGANSGTFSQSGGTSTISNTTTLSNGIFAISSGTCNLQGAFNVGTGTYSVTLNQSGGTIYQTSSSKTTLLNATANISSGLFQTYGLEIGNGVTYHSTVNHSGGTVDVTASRLKIFTSSSYICSNSPIIRLKRDLYNDGTFTRATSDVIFEGNSMNQQIAGLSTTTLHNVTVAITGYDLDIITSANITGVLTLTTGKINTSHSAVLTLKSGATTTVGNANSYVNGPLYLEKASSGVTTFNIPIGRSGDWRPVELSVNHSTATSYTYKAEMTKSSAVAKDWSLPGDITHVSYVRYWTINRFASSNLSTEVPSSDLVGNQIVSLYYGTNDFVDDPSYLRVCKGTASSWVDIGGTGATTGTGKVTSTSAPSAFNSFSDFTLGNATGGGNELPIELVSFNVKKSDSGIQCLWETKTETNNDYFTIEYSKDGITFYELTDIAGAGTTTHNRSYEYDLEFEIEGFAYFRLKQTDYDGKTSYSTIETLEIQNHSSEISLYPIPAKDYIIVNTNQHIVSSITVYTNSFSKVNVPSNGNTLYISSLPAGIYYIGISTELGTIYKEFIKN